MWPEQRVLRQDDRTLLHTVFSSSALISWQEESTPGSMGVHDSPTWREPSLEQVAIFTTFLSMCWGGPPVGGRGQVEAHFSSHLGNTGGHGVTQPGCSCGCSVDTRSDGVCEAPALLSAFCEVMVRCSTICPGQLCRLDPVLSEFPSNNRGEIPDFSVWQTPLVTSLLGGNGMIKLTANRPIAIIWKECLPINKM